MNKFIFTKSESVITNKKVLQGKSWRNSVRHGNTYVHADTGGSMNFNFYQTKTCFWDANDDDYDQ